MGDGRGGGGRGWYPLLIHTSDVIGCRVCIFIWCTCKYSTSKYKYSTSTLRCIRDRLCVMRGFKCYYNSNIISYYTYTIYSMIVLSCSRDEMVGVNKVRFASQVGCVRIG